MLVLPFICILHYLQERDTKKKGRHGNYSVYPHRLSHILTQKYLAGMTPGSCTIQTLAHVYLDNNNVKDVESFRK